MTIQPYEHHEPTAVPALLDRTTDSWTAVLTDVVALANNIAGTEFVPKDMRGSVPKVAAAILYSRELGLPPMTGLAGVHVINGRPGIYSEMMRALILEAGHELRVVETSVARCRMRGRRRGADDWTEVTYTMEEAKLAGDYQKNSNYRTRPADMLVARCTSRLARLEFADVIHGLRSVEELQDLAGEVVDADGVVAAVPAVETTTVQRAPRRKATPAAVTAAAEVVPEGEAGTGEGAGQAAADPAPSTPARRRPDLPRRGAVRAPQQPAEPEPDEPHDAEVLPDEPPAEPVRQAEVKPLEERVRGAVGVLVGHLNRLGVTDRDDRLRWTSWLVGHEVTTTTGLDLAELTHAIRRIERLRDYDELVEWAQQAADAERAVKES